MLADNEKLPPASWIRNVDHITYACTSGNLVKWAWYHIEVEGGTLISRIDDVLPNGKSSMAIWCVDHGTFGSVLIEGIDRSEKSQVSAFAEKHGDHSVQHIAFNTTNLPLFRERLESFGGQMRGDTLMRHDGFGILSQVFGRGFEPGKADESPFPEYVERPVAGKEVAPITISKGAGKGFYAQIEDAVAENDTDSLIDLDKCMPKDWKVPEVKPHNSGVSNNEITEKLPTRVAETRFMPREMMLSAAFVLTFIAGAMSAVAISRAS